MGDSGGVIGDNTFALNRMRWSRGAMDKEQIRQQVESVLLGLKLTYD